MNQEKIEYTDVGYMGAVTATEDAYNNNYPAGNVVKKRIMGHHVIRAISVTDETQVRSTGEGVKLVTTKTQPDTLGKIKQNIESITAGEAKTEQKQFPPEPREKGDGEEGLDGNRLRKVSNDGYIEFLPPSSKEKAKYREKGESGFDGGHDRCESCAHYIEGGACHMVRGNIMPNDYCEEFFADVGFYGHEHQSFVELNLAKWGEKFSWDEDDADEFLEKIRQKLGNRQ